MQEAPAIRTKILLLPQKKKRKSITPITTTTTPALQKLLSNNHRRQHSFDSISTEASDPSPRSCRSCKSPVTPDRCFKSSVDHYRAVTNNNFETVNYKKSFISGHHHQELLLQSPRNASVGAKDSSYCYLPPSIMINVQENCSITRLFAQTGDTTGGSSAAELAAVRAGHGSDGPLKVAMTIRASSDSGSSHSTTQQQQPVFCPNSPLVLLSGPVAGRSRDNVQTKCLCKHPHSSKCFNGSDMCIQHPPLMHFSPGAVCTPAARCGGQFSSVPTTVMSPPSRCSPVAKTTGQPRNHTRRRNNESPLCGHKRDNMIVANVPDMRRSKWDNSNPKINRTVANVESIADKRRSETTKPNRSSLKSPCSVSAAALSQTGRKVQYRKTRVCPWFLNGCCVMGNSCNYAHNDKELRNRPNLACTRLCPTVGSCQDSSCRFAHDPSQLRATGAYFRTKLCKYWQQGFCPVGRHCRHAHGEAQLRRPDCCGTVASEPLSAEQLAACLHPARPVGITALESAGDNNQGSTEVVSSTSGSYDGDKTSTGSVELNGDSRVMSSRTSSRVSLGTSESDMVEEYEAAKTSTTETRTSSPKSDGFEDFVSIQAGASEISLPADMPLGLNDRSMGHQQYKQLTRDLQNNKQDENVQSDLLVEALAHLLLDGNAAPTSTTTLVPINHATPAPSDNIGYPSGGSLLPLACSVQQHSSYGGSPNNKAQYHQLGNFESLMTSSSSDNSLIPVAVDSSNTTGCCVDEDWKLKDILSWAVSSQDPDLLECSAKIIRACLTLRGKNNASPHLSNNINVNMNTEGSTCLYRMSHQQATPAATLLHQSIHHRACPW